MSICNKTGSEKKEPIFFFIMKVKELIKELEQYDEDLEVKTDNMHRQGLMTVTTVKIQYKNLDEKYVYVG